MKSFNMHALSKRAAEQHHGLSHKFAAWVRVGGDRFYYMASSVSGQAKSSYPTGQDGVILPAQDYPPCPTKKKFPKAILKLLKFVGSRWLDIGLVNFCQFLELDPVSVHKHAKKNLANIQPS